MPGDDHTGEEPCGEELWSTCLDGPYLLRLEMTADQRTGRLMLTHIVTGAVLLDEPVPLPAGAMYGLAGSELRRWRKRGWQAIAWQRRLPFGSTPANQVQEQQQEPDAQNISDSRREEPHD